MVWDGSALTVNGNIISTGNIVNNAVTQQGGSSANNDVQSNGTWITILQGSYVQPGQSGSVSVVTSCYVTLGQSYSIYGSFPTPSYFRLYRCYDNTTEVLLSEWSIGLFTVLATWSIFDTIGSDSQVFYRVKAYDISETYSSTLYQNRSLIVLATKK